MTLPLDHYLAQLDAEGDAFEQLALNGDLSASVRTCPDWDVAELIGHTAAVYNWAAETLRVGRAGRDALVPPEGDLVAGSANGSTLCDSSWSPRAATAMCGRSLATARAASGTAAWLMRRQCIALTHSSR